MAKCKVRSFRKFSKEIYEVFAKKFCENGKEKLSPNDFSILSNLKNFKTNTILTT